MAKCPFQLNILTKKKIKLAYKNVPYLTLEWMNLVIRNAVYCLVLVSTDLFQTVWAEADFFMISMMVIEQASCQRII